MNLAVAKASCDSVCGIIVSNCLCSAVSCAELNSSCSSAVKLGFDKPQRKENFNQGPLKHVVPPSPSVEDQAFDEQGVKEHQERRWNDPAAQPVWEIQFVGRRLSEFSGFCERIACLFTQPSIKILSVIVIDPS